MPRDTKRMFDRLSKEAHRQLVAERDDLRERVSKLTEALISIAENDTEGLDPATYAYSVLNPD